MTGSDRGDLRSLRKQLLVAESMLMRERLARDLRRATRPARIFRQALGTAPSALPARTVFGILGSWLYSRWRRRRDLRA